ncbi:hypothetical protein BDQ17DRAFT_1545570 [Cyathus striatus]|nr:hypothetical protein BDQ17DRAFT_1545570 [Cyathus striatus]
MSSRYTIPSIPEILRKICEHLSPQKHTLASLARTCRMFEEPALDMLWFEADFCLLAKCLPPHTWTVERKYWDCALVLTQSLSTTDCLRFLEYARRVQRFTNLHKGGKLFVHVTVYQALQAVMNGAKILPNVQKIRWTCNDYYYTPFIHMFLGPRLKELQLIIFPILTSQITVISALSEYYSSLESISFWFFYDGSRSIQRKAVQLISSAVFQLENLKSLEVPNLPYSTLLQVSHFPHLRELKITKCNLDAVEPGTADGSGGFPALTTLRLGECKNITDCIAVLILMRCSPLRRVMFSFTEVETSTAWKQVFLTLIQHCDQNSLTYIECYDGKDHGDDTFSSSHEEMENYEVLEPLLTFHNLESIDIKTTKGFYFSDASMIKNMATTWRKLRNLNLTQCPYSRGSDQPTVKLLDLLHFAENCPELVSLGLTFDATFPPELDRDSIPWGNISTTQLEELDVADSPIENPPLVAAILSGIFPSLENIVTIEEKEYNRDPGETEGHKSWKQVEGLLELFSVVRDQTTTAVLKKYSISTPEV